MPDVNITPNVDPSLLMFGHWCIPCEWFQYSCSTKPSISLFHDTKEIWSEKLGHGRECSGSVPNEL
jgi:hypothetical protein